MDSQCLSYLVDALTQISIPKDALALQRIALAKIFFYCPGTLWTTPTVSRECAKIRQIQRAELHQSWILTHFGILPFDQSATERRATDLSVLHSGKNDCLILAEAEATGYDVLITNDRAFRRNLSPHSKVLLINPAEYWGSMAVPPGTVPSKAPTLDNPLSGQVWWRA